MRNLVRRSGLPSSAGLTVDGPARSLESDPSTAGLLVDSPSRALALTKAEAAESLGISQRKLEQYIGSGELPSIKFGRARRVLTSDLAAFAQHLRDETLRAEHPADGGGRHAMVGRARTSGGMQ